MGRHAKTQAIVEAAREILERDHPMTLRQVYYRLVSGQVIENNRTAYAALSTALVSARKDGAIPWEWMEDRTRRPRRVPSWSGLEDFATAAIDSYRRDPWREQPRYVEAWLEKDALSGIFEQELDPYGVTLNVGRGYDGWDSIRNAAERYGDGSGTTVLYFGDLDPSGEDMARSLRERLAYFACWPEIVKVALTLDDVEQHALPPNPTKSRDTRQAAYVKQHGDRCWELDALPPQVLRVQVVAAVQAHMDLDALGRVEQHQERERRRLKRLLAGESAPGTP